MTINRSSLLPARSIASVIALTSSLEAQHDAGASHGRPNGDFVKVVRDATERFKDVAVAEAEGYASDVRLRERPGLGRDGPALRQPLARHRQRSGSHAAPEIVIYEPLPNGGLKLHRRRLSWCSPPVGMPPMPAHPPAPGGQLMHLFESPNRFGLPDFYTLHVWAWQDNPSVGFELALERVVRFVQSSVGARNERGAP